MDEFDDIFIALVRKTSAASPVIACLFSGENFPGFCAGMPRNPMPPIGHRFTTSLAIVLEDAIRSNAAIHDGAIMLRHMPNDGGYTVAGWSFRLFPPLGRTIVEPNRGSAFNSCLAMSEVESIDGVYLASSAGVHRFCRGIAFPLN